MLTILISQAILPFDTIAVYRQFHNESEEGWDPIYNPLNIILKLSKANNLIKKLKCLKELHLVRLLRDDLILRFNPILEKSLGRGSVYLSIQVWGEHRCGG